MSNLRPTATSRLSAAPLPKLLVHACQRNLGGTVVLETPTHKKSAILFEGGAAAKVMSAEPVHFLGEVLRDLGLIDDATHQSTLTQAAQERRLHGQVLISQGKLTTQDLHMGLREQLRRKIAWMAEHLPGDTVAGYYDGQNLIARWGGPDSTVVSAVSLLWPCTRNAPDHDDMDRTLSKLESRILRIHRMAQLGSFKLDRNEQALLDVMRAKPQTLHDLYRSGFDEGLVRRLVYAMALARFLDLGSKGPEPLRPPTRQAPTAKPQAARGTAARTTPAARPRSSDETGAFRAEILDRAKNVEQQTYYEILGVEPSAPNATIQAAFFQLARRWHPDRIGSELEDVREHALKIFSRMSEAHATLTDTERRTEYERVLKEGGATAGEQEQINAIVKAASAFQRAEILMKRGKLEEAEKDAALAYEGDRTQPEYGALYAWIRAQRLDPSDEEAFRELIRIANQSAEQAKEHVRIRFYRGMVLKRAGKSDVAIRDFRFVAEAEPRHVDAQREIRLYKMRKQGPSSETASGKPGIFGGLFKK